MNSLNSLLKVCHHLPDKKHIIGAYEAERFKLQTPNGKSIADVGCEPILHMRQFQVSLLEFSISHFIDRKHFGIYGSPYFDPIYRLQKYCRRSLSTRFSTLMAMEGQYCKDEQICLLQMEALQIYREAQNATGCECTIFNTTEVFGVRILCNFCNTQFLSLPPSVWSVFIS